MRLVYSIIAFCAAAILVGAGIAQRTIFLEPGSVSLSIETRSDAPYTVISSPAMTVNAGQQTVSVKGDGEVFVAYGRTEDVLAWVGDSPYTLVGLDDVTGELVSKEVTPETATNDADTATTEPAPAPSIVSPAGSDLWMGEAKGDGQVSGIFAAPKGYAAIVSGDGNTPAPSSIELTWPLDNATPWAGPMFVLGLLSFLAGIALFLLYRSRRGGGPRRKGLPAPESPQPRQRALPASKAPKRKELGPSRGRRALRPFAAVVPLAAAVVLSGCSADYWPSFESAEPVPTETPLELEDDELSPAVTVPQMQRILTNISQFAIEADKNMSKDVLSQRFVGPALASREANYAIRSSLSDYPAPVAIPARPLTITLPEQVADSWPRVVMTVSQNESDQTIPPLALVMIQESPRENYRVYYAASLVPGVKSPQLPPASTGAPLVVPDSKLLLIAPNELAAAYADVLNQEEASAFATVFLAEGDSLREQLGKAGQQAIRTAEGFPANAAIEFVASAGDSPPVALATNDSGAIVAVSVNQVRKITPTDGGTVGWQSGASSTLSGFTGKSARGVQSTSGLQLLFYVPAVGSNAPIEMLGWTESLVAASEIPG